VSQCCNKLQQVGLCQCWSISFTDGPARLQVTLTPGVPPSCIISTLRHLVTWENLQFSVCAFLFLMLLYLRPLSVVKICIFSVHAAVTSPRRQQLLVRPTRLALSDSNLNSHCDESFKSCANILAALVCNYWWVRGLNSHLTKCPHLHKYPLLMNGNLQYTKQYITLFRIFTVRCKLTVHVFTGQAVLLLGMLWVICFLKSSLETWSHFGLWFPLLRKGRRTV
jgi:hypothetical protein